MQLIQIFTLMVTGAAVASAQSCRRPEDLVKFKLPTQGQVYTGNGCGGQCYDLPGHQFRDGFTEMLPAMGWDCTVYQDRRCRGSSLSLANPQCSNQARLDFGGKGRKPEWGSWRCQPRNFDKFAQFVGVNGC